MSAEMTTKNFFAQDNVKKKFEELLGKRAPQFITSVLQIVSQSDMLSKAEPGSVYNAAATAATLDLPLNANLGFAYIIPYNNKTGCVAQFQMGYKGFIQLAQRSGQFKTISACPIYDGQLVSSNPLTGYVFDFSKRDSDEVIGYAGYFSLINGFEKTTFMSIGEIKKHGERYSQTFRKGYGLWKDDFDAMATKTVLKLLLSKYAPLSVEMQRAVVADQAVVNDVETEDVTYIDNEPEDENKAAERALLAIDSAKNLKTLSELRGKISDEVQNTVVRDNKTVAEVLNERMEEMAK
jgi:recombination protein RecT